MQTRLLPYFPAYTINKVLRGVGACPGTGTHWEAQVPFCTLCGPSWRGAGDAYAASLISGCSKVLEVISPCRYDTDMRAVGHLAPGILIMVSPPFVQTHSSDQSLTSPALPWLNSHLKGLPVSFAFGETAGKGIRFNSECVPREGNVPRCSESWRREAARDG